MARSPTQALRQILSDYGMLLVLLGLGIFFSIATWTETQPTGRLAAEQVAGDLLKTHGFNARVMIVVGTQANDEEYVDELTRRLQQAGATVTAVSRGEPRDAKKALQKLVADPQAKLDAFACTDVSGNWLVVQESIDDFPSLNGPPVYVPHSYGWPIFLKTDNLLNIANQIAVIAIIAIGMTMVIITGGIDLSVGSLLALSSVLTTWFIRELAGGPAATVFGMTLACCAAILLSGGAGAFSGLMITWFGIPPFIATLGMMLVGSGLAYLLAEGQSVYQIPDSFVWLGRGADWLSLPNAVVLMLVLYGLAHLLMSQMRIGRYLYAVGGNREAARLSGLPVRRVLLFAYVCSGLLAGLGGVVMASQLKSGSPTYGQMYELYVIAAVVVGGSSLSGGRGKMLGTLIGAFIIAVIQNGMNLTNVESYTQKVVLGAVILTAVLLDKIKRSGWRAIFRGSEPG